MKNDEAIHALGIDRCLSSGGKCEECEDLRNCPDGKLLMQRRRLRMQEDVEFNISQVYDVCLYDNRWYIKEYPNEIPINCVTYIIDPATTQPAGLFCGVKL